MLGSLESCWNKAHLSRCRSGFGKSFFALTYAVPYGILIPIKNRTENVFMITVNNVSLDFSGQKLFSDVSL